MLGLQQQLHSMPALPCTPVPGSRSRDAEKLTAFAHCDCTATRATCEPLTLSSRLSLMTDATCRNDHDLGEAGAQFCSCASDIMIKVLYPLADGRRKKIPGLRGKHSPRRGESSVGAADNGPCTSTEVHTPGPPTQGPPLRHERDERIGSHGRQDHPDLGTGDAAGALSLTPEMASGGRLSADSGSAPCLSPAACLFS